MNHSCQISKDSIELLTRFSLKQVKADVTKLCNLLFNKFIFPLIKSLKCPLPTNTMRLTEEGWQVAPEGQDSEKLCARPVPGKYCTRWGVPLPAPGVHPHLRIHYLGIGQEPVFTLGSKILDIQQTHKLQCQANSFDIQVVYLYPTPIISRIIDTCIPTCMHQD